MRTLISSEKRKRLMRLILRNPDRIPGVREAAKECRMSPASVSIFMRQLEKDGIIKRGRLVLENPELRALRILFNAERIVPAIASLGKKFTIKGIGMYGSWAAGTNTSASDLDLWIKIDEKDEDKKAEIRSYLSQLIKDTQLNVVFLTEQSLDELRQRDKIFYSALFYSYHLGGEKIA